MLRFSPVTERDFDEVYSKMTSAFPYEERRDSYDEKECLKDSRFKLLSLIDNDTPVGFTALWVLDGFVFLEHIAIDEDKRSSGYGSKAIELIKSEFNLPIILEAEAPVTEQQIKRIAFYKRLGFTVNDYDYTQPSYHGGEGVPLMLLSFPEPMTDADFNKFIEETRKSAYR
jgi:ribosomal protein S18 acetylase RimI-like enzyme